MAELQLLHHGDKVQIVAPARKISMEELAPSIQYFQSQGLEVVCGDLLLGQCHQFSGTDMERAADMQQAIDNEDIKAVICARGGYGGMRIVDMLDFTAFKAHPKWLCGYSDTTVFHAHIHTNTQVPTLHCTMPVNIHSHTDHSTALNTMMQAMFTGKLVYDIPSVEGNRPGETCGPVVGGNLSILYAINGSASDIDTKDKILFIEDLDEYLYHIDRMMLCLKRSGKLSHLKGLIVGGMSDMHDNTIPFGYTAKQIILHHVQEYNYPVCFDFPAGHIEDNRAIIMGATSILNVTESKVTLQISL